VAAASASLTSAKRRLTSASSPPGRLSAGMLTGRAAALYLAAHFGQPRFVPRSPVARLLSTTAPLRRQRAFTRARHGGRARHRASVDRSVPCHAARQTPERLVQEDEAAGTCGWHATQRPMNDDTRALTRSQKSFGPDVGPASLAAERSGYGRLVGSVAASQSSLPVLYNPTGARAEKVSHYGRFPKPPLFALFRTEKP
jgi:hypothetical protein